jgi:hypothetical protein
MSDFNKEQLWVFIHNSISASGFLFSYHILTQSFNFFVLNDYLIMITYLMLGSLMGIISTWLIVSTLKKSFNEYMNTQHDNEFVIMLKELELQLQNKKKEYEKQIEADKE